MTIRDEKEYKDYEARVEKLIERGTELGDMELLSQEEKAEFTMLSEPLMSMAVPIIRCLAG